MPAEWSVHQRTFLSWPIQASMCYPEDYNRVCKEYYQRLVKAIAEFEPVTVIINPEKSEGFEAIIQDEETSYPIDYLIIPHNDAWLRDNGPTFVINDQGGIAGVNWEFNAWGGKYSPWDLDNEVAPKILDHYDIQRFDAPLVMEGGSIHTDGEGTILTTEECLLNPNRNPSLSKGEIEQYLHSYLGSQQVIWLKRGLYGDETDGHIDNIACFAAPGKILLQVCEDKDDPNYDISRENVQILRDSVDAKGRRLEVFPVPQPPMRMFEGKRLTLSYINFYFVNKGIILPVFGGDADETDAEVIDILSQLYPDRSIIQIDGMTIIKEGGNVHCTTQQMPRKQRRGTVLLLHNEPKEPSP